MHRYNKSITIILLAAFLLLNVLIYPSYVFAADNAGDQDTSMLPQSVQLLANNESTYASEIELILAYAKLLGIKVVYCDASGLNVAVELPEGLNVNTLVSLFESSALSSEVTVEGMEQIDDGFNQPVTFKVYTQIEPTKKYTVTAIAEGVAKYGDVSGDQKVTAGDATLILRQVVGLTSFTSQQGIAADVSGDGKITAGDATLILRRVVSLILKFPVEN